MKIFVTGATGFVGSAVVDELLQAGHDVLGLARSQASAQALTAKGAEILRGDLEDLDSLQAGARAADAVIHTGFVHDFSRFSECCAIDVKAIEAMGHALEGSVRPLIVTSGLAMLAKGRLATEADPAHVPSASYPRATEAAAKAVAERGVRVAAMRLPASVHGRGDHGFVPMLIDFARKSGISAYVGEGSNLWAAVQRDDAARAYRLAIEHGARDGPYHAAAEESLSFKSIAQAIGSHLGLPAISLSEAEAQAHFTWFTMFAAMDGGASSTRTRAILNWTPEKPGLFADMKESGYFDS